MNVIVKSRNIAQRAWHTSSTVCWGRRDSTLTETHTFFVLGKKFLFALRQDFRAMKMQSSGDSLRWTKVMYFGEELRSTDACRGMARLLALTAAF